MENTLSTGTNVNTLRQQAPQNLQQGAVTDDYTLDLTEVLKQLNDALATEIVCVLRYKRHHFMAKGIHAKPIAAEFAEHAAAELEHADALARRIVQLGGEPDFAPDSLSTRSHAKYTTCTTLDEMIAENLKAERIAIIKYKEMIHYVGDKDPTTRRILEDILAAEEEHAEDMADLLNC